MSDEISPRPGPEGTNKIGWGIIIVPYQEHSCTLCTFDITPLIGGFLEVI